MKKLLHVEVEPLPEQRWAKIERSLIARLREEPQRFEHFPERRARKKGLTRWLVAAVAITMLAAVVLAVRSLPDATLTEYPSRITTGDSPSHLALPGLALDVEPQSAVVVGAETPQGLLIVLDRGSIVCRVKPRASDAPLVVQAGAARVRVLGTHFSVTRNGETARVEVHEGVVEVTSRGQSERVQAGEEWPAAAGPHALGDTVGALDSGPAPSDAGSKVEARSTPTSAPVPATKAPRAEAARDAEAIEGRPRTAPPAAHEPRTPEAVAKPDADREDQSEPRASAQSIFEQATALERTDPARASELYRSLASGTGSWARNALYARGRLEASRGNLAEARRLLQQYLERFPRGNNAEDARAVLRRLR